MIFANVFGISLVFHVFLKKLEKPWKFRGFWGEVRGGGAPPASTVLGVAAVQGECTRGSGDEKIEIFESSQKCSEWLEMGS